MIVSLFGCLCFGVFVLFGLQPRGIVDYWGSVVLELFDCGLGVGSCLFFDILIRLSPTPFFLFVGVGGWVGGGERERGGWLGW